ncbi:MAG TPA: SNF2-related protein [Spirochaetota bacterium]|nr:SNF2-related protein [Spirochaetota bacterium]
MKAETVPVAEDLFSLASVEPAGTGIDGEDELRSLLLDGPLPLDGRFELRAEACALQLAHANNKILSLSNSRTRILAHQVESTHRIVNSLNRRFIIADEVGLGKTIEAGLVIKELIYRHGYARILIISPASLLLQWQHEMENKFNEHFEVLDRRFIRRAQTRGGRGSNPWRFCEKAICSLDFIKNRCFAASLSASRWDAVIFDEAHRLRRDSQKSTLAYTVAEVLSRNTRSLLLLTATPFRGKLEELYYLVGLVDKNLLGPYQTFYNRYCMDGADLAPLRDRLSSVLIRRTKKEVGGFTRRFARTIRFDLYPGERELYDATTRYVVEEFNRAMQAENRAVGFVMTVFQKLLDSSSFALLSALANRRNNLAAMLERAESAAAAHPEFDPEDADIDDENADEAVAALVRKSAAEIREEIATLERLIALARSITINKKGEKLASLLRQLRRQGHGKFIIFTQFRTTQEYLCGLLDDFSVELFHGSMDRDEKEKALLDFRQGAEVLICTEAGGEGRNMQFCNILINYDLPWSPLKIEQRIGRVHRFGQPYDVFIYNFSTRNTVAERVLEVLERKLKLFEESIGVPDVLLGRIEDELALSSLFMEMAAGVRPRKRILAEVDERIENARRSYEKLSDLTVARNLDFNYDEYYSITMKERQFSNRRIERFVERMGAIDGAVGEYLGRKNPRTGLYRIRPLPGRRVEASCYGSFDSKIALENESIEFLAFGHRIVDSLFARCGSDEFGGKTGVKIIRSPAPFKGMVFCYLVTLNALSPTQELMVVAADGTGRRDDEFSEIEREFIEQEGMEVSGGDFDRDFRRVITAAGDRFDEARGRLERRMERRLADLRETLDLSIDPEIDKITEASDTRIRELSEQLERQECQHKWFGRDMRSALTRTRNEIAQVEMERERLLAGYRRCVEARPAVRLVCAGVLIAVADALSRNVF